MRKRGEGIERRTDTRGVRNEAFNRRMKTNIKAFGMEMYKLKSSNTAKCSGAIKQDGLKRTITNNAQRALMNMNILKHVKTLFYSEMN